MAYYADGSSGPQGSYSYVITPPVATVIGDSSVTVETTTTTTPTTTPTTTSTTTSTTTPTTTPSTTSITTPTTSSKTTSTTTPSITQTAPPTTTPTPVTFNQQSTTGTHLVTQSNVTLNNEGVSQTAGQIATIDGNVSFNVAAGSKLLNAQGQPITQVLADILTSVPPPPPQSTIVLPYEFGPSGATFVPPLTMTLKYDPAKLPPGVSESTLYIAYWDGSRWQNLPSTVDTTNNTVTALVPHFTDIAVLGQVATTSLTTPSVIAAATPTTGLSGWLITIIIVVVIIVIAAIIWLFVPHRRQN